jgi:hypothetical protein
MSGFDTRFTSLDPRADTSSLQTLHQPSEAGSVSGVFYEKGGEILKVKLIPSFIIPNIKD